MNQKQKFNKGALRREGKTAVQATSKKQVRRLAVAVATPQVPQAVSHTLYYGYNPDDNEDEDEDDQDTLNPDFYEPPYPNYPQRVGYPIRRGRGG